MARDSPRWMRFPKSPAQMNLVPNHPIKCMAGMRSVIPYHFREHANTLIPLRFSMAQHGLR